MGSTVQQCDDLCLISRELQTEAKTLFLMNTMERGKASGLRAGSGSKLGSRSGWGRGSLPLLLSDLSAFSCLQVVTTLGHSVILQVSSGLSLPGCTVITSWSPQWHPHESRRHLELQAVTFEPHTPCHPLLTSRRVPHLPCFLETGCLPPFLPNERKIHSVFWASTRSWVRAPEPRKVYIVLINYLYDQHISMNSYVNLKSHDHCFLPFSLRVQLFWNKSLFILGEVNDPNEN